MERVKRRDCSSDQVLLGIAANNVAVVHHIVRVDQVVVETVVVVAVVVVVVVVVAVVDVVVVVAVVDVVVVWLKSGIKIYKFGFIVNHVRGCSTIHQ